MTVAEAGPVTGPHRAGARSPDRLPHPRDRIELGASGRQVSPICIGMVGEPAVVPAAYDAGCNFFFLTADLHWPLYRGLRRGLEQLLDRGGGIRDDIVVGVVSYLEEPLFQYLQVNEVIAAVKGLERVDLLIAGAVHDIASYNARVPSLWRARAGGHAGASAVGASFHDRSVARSSIQQDLIDIHFIRYNSGHPGALREVFPYVPPVRSTALYNFKSTMSRVTPEVASAARAAGIGWLPRVQDHYRFVLSQPAMDGVLCSPMKPSEVPDLVSALEDGPLTGQEQEYMIGLATSLGYR